MKMGLSTYWDDHCLREVSIYVDLLANEFPVGITKSCLLARRYDMHANAVGTATPMANGFTATRRN